MAKFEKTFVNYALGALILISLFAFIVTIQEDNNVTDGIIEVEIINETFSQLKDDLGSGRDTSQSQLELFQKEEPTIGFGSLILFSVVSSGKVFTGIIIGTFNLLIKLPMVIFGVDPVISAVLSTILIIGFILGLWVLYKLGG